MYRNEDGINPINGYRRIKRISTVFLSVVKEVPGTARTNIKIRKAKYPQPQIPN